MNCWRRLSLLACILVIFLPVVGCHSHKQREMRLHEEQQEGEVHEAQPGEMIVE